LTAGEAKNVDNAVVLARLFNEASGQKAPSEKHGLFISRPFKVKLMRRSVYFGPNHSGANTNPIVRDGLIKGLRSTHR
jgi:hypothetical protein